MLGVYDYTVILTYMSALSAGLGIIVTLNGDGHPYMGIFFLMFCGLCDAFDGKVARTKKNRTEVQKNFGIQIDSLSDLLAFGALPACIGNAMIRVSPSIPEVPRFRVHTRFEWGVAVLFFVIILLYLLAALIRLAYFNVMEEVRQKNEGGVRKYYEGLPVTSASLIFPMVLLLQYVLPMDITWVYFGVMLITGFLFVSKIKIRKPGMKSILLMIGVGAVVFAALLLLPILIHRR